MADVRFVFALFSLVEKKKKKVFRFGCKFSEKRKNNHQKPTPFNCVLYTIVVDSYNDDCESCVVLNVFGMLIVCHIQKATK